MKIIFIVLLHLFISNIHAVDRVKRINNFIKKGPNVITSCNYLGPLYKDYAFIFYNKEAYEYPMDGWIDVKNLKIIDDTVTNKCIKNLFIAYDGFVDFGSIVYKIDGTEYSDKIENFIPFHKNLILTKSDTTGFDIVLYKRGNVVSRSHNEDYGKSRFEIVYNDFFILDDDTTSTLYDKNLNLLIKGVYICKSISKINQGGFYELYPRKEHQYFFCFCDKKNTIIAYDRKARKKMEIPFKYDSKLEHHWDEATFFSEKKYAVLGNMTHYVVNITTGRPIIPTKYNFIGYFKENLICEYNNKTLAITTEGETTSQIKVGKYCMVDCGTKWILKTPFYTDSIEKLNGLNSDEYIGVTIKGKLGIIGKKGNIIVPPQYQEIFIDKFYFVCHSTKDTYDIYDKKGKLYGKDLLAFYFDETDIEYQNFSSGFKIDRNHYMFFKIEDGKYQYFLRNKKKSKVFYADEFNTEDLSNRFLPIKKDGIWQYLEIK